MQGNFTQSTCVTDPFDSNDTFRIGMSFFVVGMCVGSICTAWGRHFFSSLAHYFSSKNSINVKDVNSQSTINELIDTGTPHNQDFEHNDEALQFPVHLVSKNFTYSHHNDPFFNRSCFDIGSHTSIIYDDGDYPVNRISDTYDNDSLEPVGNSLFMDDDNYAKNRHLSLKS